MYVGMRHIPFPALLVCCAALALVWPLAGSAQPNLTAPPVTGTTDDLAISTWAGQALDDAILAFRNDIYRVGGNLGEIARNAMLSLLVVDLVLRGGRGIFGNESIPGLMRGFAFQFGFVCCIWGFTFIVPQVVDTLAGIALDVANAAGGAEVEAGGMVTQGLARAAHWLGEINIIAPGTWFYLIAAAISIVVMAIAVAMLVVTYAELYFAGMAGLITLMFAGLTETRSIALNLVNSLVGKAFKLMGLMIIVAATGEMTTALATRSGSGLANAMGMITLQIVSAILILTLPGTLEGLVGAKFSSRAAEMVGKVAGGVAKLAVATGLGAAAGAVAGAATGALGAAKAGAGGKGIAKAAATGARDRGIDWGRAIHDKDVMASVGRKVAHRLGHGGAKGDEP
ncbi:type IV secretion system protein [Ruegeria atlantica]|uniref:type IV secretion system protein n=1 Tax=Ruegeria atlantica TaxID=81569 RepID=UPI00147A191C|nr:type IV secretion system protein [Ruegeria atlantica]